MNINHHIYNLSHSNKKLLLLTLIITSVFIIIEIMGGLISGSLALLSDAGHMISDAVALIFAIFAIQFSNRPSNKLYTFGLLRLSTIAAFINAILLISINIFIIWDTIERFYYPKFISGKIIIIIAIIGLIFNSLSLWILHHSKEKRDFNFRVILLHILGDLVGSIAMIISGVIISLTKWTLIDQILSTMVSCLILYNVWKPLKDSVNELLEGSPTSINIDNLTYNLCQFIPEVSDVHHVHVWLIGEKPVITLHVQVIKTYEYNDLLLYQIQSFIKDNYQIFHSTIQIEDHLCSNKICQLNKDYS